MEVSLDGAHGASQGLGQGLHLGPAQTRFVVAVVSEGTICRDCLGRDSGEDEGLDLGDTGKLGLLRHRPPPISSAAVRFDDRIHQSGGSSAKRIQPRRFFYALFTGGYFTYTGILALAPEPLPTMPATRRVATRYARRPRNYDPELEQALPTVLLSSSLPGAMGNAC